jgi:hypothetical protein
MNYEDYIDNDYCESDDIIERTIKEYDIYIQELMRRLQIVKDERKEAQGRIKTVEHRLMLLQNQEKLVHN